MRGRYGSLYDTYQLHNSSAIPMYQGSAAPEMLEVSRHLQGLYDTAKAGADEISSAAGNLRGFNENDEALAKETRDNINGQISKMAAAKDWENNVDAVRGLGRNYAQRAQELAAPFQQYQDWVKNDLENKDYGLVPYQKRILDQMARSSYKGLTKDASGRLIGRFTGPYLAKNMDMPKFVDTVMAGMKEFSGASKIDSTADGYIVTRGNKTEYVSSGRVKAALDDAIRIHPEMQAFLKQEGDMAQFLGNRIQPGDIKDEKTRKQFEMQAQAQGLPFSDVYGATMRDQRTKELLSSAHDYAQNKYVYSKVEGEFGLKSDDAYWKGLERTDKMKDEFRLAGTGPNTVPEWATNYESLDKEIKGASTNADNLQQQLSIAERQLKAAPKNTDLQARVISLRQDAAQAQKILDNNKSLLNNSRDLAVQDLKLSDGKGGFVSTFNQFVDSKKDQVAQVLAKDLPNGVTADGKQYSVQDIAKAIAAGNYRIHVPQTGGQGAGAVGGVLDRYTTYEVTMPDGRVINSDKAPGLRNIGTAVASNHSNLLQIEARAKELHGSAVKNFSIVGNAIGLADNEREAIKNFGLAGATIYKSPGSSSVVADEDLRKQKFHAEQYIPETGRLTGRFYNEDKKTWSEPMDIRFNSNINKNLFEKLSRTNSGGKWDAYLGSLNDASYSGPLLNMKPGQKLTGVPDVQGLSTSKPLMLPGTGKKVHLAMTSDHNGVPQWAVTDPDGDIIKDEKGEPFITNSITTADYWTREFGVPQTRKK